MKRERVITGNVYHVLNRGVDRRSIFLDDSDYLRFIHNLFEFNDVAAINNVSHHYSQNNVIRSRYLQSGPVIKKEKKPRELLVELLAFALMPNHYHLLLRPRFDNGITRFMKRLNMGYSRHFNERYERVGALFQGRYKICNVKRDAHFIHLPYYIHFNPLDLFAPEWRERRLNNLKKSKDFLMSYRWSSFIDYMGVKNFPSVTQRDFLNSCFGGADAHKENFDKWLRDLDCRSVEDIILE